MSAWLVALSAGAVAQLVKLALALVRAGHFTPHMLFNLPGMPSTWAAMCGALCTVVGSREGWNSAVFAAVVAFSCLVLYDSLGLRRAAGRQVRIVKSIAIGLRLHRTEAASRHLRELLGDSPAQLVGGLLVGTAVALPFVL